MNGIMEAFVLNNSLQKSANIITIKIIIDEIDFYTEHEYVHPLGEEGMIPYALWVMDIKNKFYESFKKTGTFGLIEKYEDSFQCVNFLFRKEGESERSYELRMEEWADNLDEEIERNSFVNFKSKFTEEYNNNK